MIRLLAYHRDSGESPLWETVMATNSVRAAIGELVIVVLTLSAAFALFLLLYVAKRQLWPSSIIFLEGIAVSIVAAAISCVAFLYFQRMRAGATAGAAAIFLFVAGFFLNYAFIITFPTLLDRSISITLLSVVDNAPDGRTTVTALNDDFLRLYVAGDSQTRKRVAEQVAIGNFQAADGSVTITAHGRMFAVANRWMAWAMNIPDTYVNATPAKAARQ